MTQDFNDPVTMTLIVDPMISYVPVWLPSLTADLGL